jgi:hypothetical protein
MTAVILLIFALSGVVSSVLSVTMNAMEDTGREWKVSANTFTGDRESRSCGD